LSKIYKNNKGKFRLKFSATLALLFLLYFFSNNQIYSETNDSDYLIPSGRVVQIDAQLCNVVVRGICENSPFLPGDSIISINDVSIKDVSHLLSIIDSVSLDEKLNVLVSRGSHEFKVSTTKDILNRNNFLDEIAGFATLTYINPETMEFGAVAHPINIAESRRALIKNGFISATTSLTVEKSSRGNVGSLSATKKDLIGKFNENTKFGIKGKTFNYQIENLQKYKVASLNEVKTGPAQIVLQDENNECRKYDIEILAIEKTQKNPAPKTFKVRVLDEDLLKKTGGIVQGMSGTPIIQDDKIIGAISHATGNDPSVGYGVFIKWMLDGK
jgi:stage IV sporulation protein B